LTLSLCLLLMSTLLGVADDSSAQVFDHSHRLARIYDFEDTDDRGNKIGFNGHLLPRNWYILGRPAIGEDDQFHRIPLNNQLTSEPGYPGFAEVGFDRSRAFSGDFSLRLGLSGGRTGAFIQHAAINAKPESDYRVTAKVFVEDLDYAWAELRAYFVDIDGRRIEESLARSAPITAETDWQDISVRLPGDFPQAAYIGIELHIIQPGIDPDNPIGLHQIVPSDITGGAWFDDIAVWELPSVNISTGSPTNIVNAPTQPQLHAHVRDLTGRRLRAVTTVYNHRLEVIDTDQDIIEDESWSWTPDLDDVYGFYWADLEIYEMDASNQPTTMVARAVTGFLWLPAGLPGATQDRSRFRLIAEDVPTEHLPLIAQLMHQTHQTGLVVSGWERRGTPASTAERAAIIEPIVRDLLVNQGYIAVSFWPVPVELAARAGVDVVDPLNILTRPADQWMDYARPFLSPLGQRMTQWQVGSSSAPQAFLARELADDIDAARRSIRTTAPNPGIIAPWRLDQPNRSSELTRQDTYAVAWPQGVTPAHLREALDGWPVPPTNIRLDIQLADAADMSQQRRIADLMLRVLYAWEANAGAVGLDRPWTETHDQRTALTPDPVLGVWSNLSQQLEGQRVIGRMPLGPGLSAMILDGRQGGMLAVWNERADENPVDLALYLGERPVEVDPFGNTHPLLAQDGKHHFTVSTTPTIIRNIDARVALMRSGFTIDRPFIPSEQIAHRRTLRIHNPWPRTLNGYYTITGPANWMIQPQRNHISIAPGDTAEVPIALRFPIHENGGETTLTADFVFDVGNNYAITLHAPMELGLEGVEFEASVIVQPGREPGTSDAVVTITITNTSDARRSLNIFAGLMGHARREMIIPAIAPGEFVSRQIFFADVGQQMGRYPLRCGVRETNGSAVLNQTLDLLAPRQTNEPPSVTQVPTP